MRLRSKELLQSNLQKRTKKELILDIQTMYDLNFDQEVEAAKDKARLEIHEKYFDLIHAYFRIF